MSLWMLLCLMIMACGSRKDISLRSYYAYDLALPLRETVKLLSDTANQILYHVSFNSIHHQRVTGLLSVPKTGEAPFPVVILMHGLGDRKEVDYVEAGNQLLNAAGYAVLRLDVAAHGERKTETYDFSFTGDYPYWTRRVISQTVFDLQRSIDFLEKRPEINTQRIGYYGISLGGIIGTVFCGLDDRVQAPVIVIAGGGLNLMFGAKALSAKTLDYVSIIDPVNFVKMIHPRPILMINAEQDEVIPPFTSKHLYRTAKYPKEIIWYPATHRTVPLEKVYQDGIDWFDKYLRE